MRYLVEALESKGLIEKGNQYPVDEIINVEERVLNKHANLRTGPGLDRIRIKIIKEVPDDYVVKPKVKKTTARRKSK